MFWFQLYFHVDSFFLKFNPWLFTIIDISLHFLQAITILSGFVDRLYFYKFHILRQFQENLEPPSKADFYFLYMGEYSSP